MPSLLAVDPRNTADTPGFRGRAAGRGRDALRIRRGSTPEPQHQEIYGLLGIGPEVIDQLGQAHEKYLMCNGCRVKTLVQIGDLAQPCLVLVEIKGRETQKVMVTLLFAVYIEFDQQQLVLAHGDSDPAK